MAWYTLFPVLTYGDGKENTVALPAIELAVPSKGHADIHIRARLLKIEKAAGANGIGAVVTGSRADIRSLDCDRSGVMADNDALGKWTGGDY